MQLNYPLIVLIAAERSGTHFVRSVINRNKAGHAVSEIANASVTPKTEDIWNFFLFKKRHLIQNTDSFIPNVENTSKLLNNYIDYLISCRNSKLPLIVDIKYAHLVNFTSGWWDVFSRPIIFDILASRSIPIIHLVRRNAFKTIISNIYATKTGVWRASTEADLKKVTISIDRGELISRAEVLTQTMELFRFWLKKNTHCEVCYEGLLEAPSADWKKIGEFLGKDIVNISSHFIKTTPPYEDIISNYQQIHDLIEE